MDKKTTDRPKPGPEPERLKLDGDWQDALRKALRKQKPTDGWPEQQRKRNAADGAD